MVYTGYQYKDPLSLSTRAVSRETSLLLLIHRVPRGTSLSPKSLERARNSTNQNIGFAVIAFKLLGTPSRLMVLQHNPW